MPAAFAPRDVNAPVKAVGRGYVMDGTITLSGNYTTGGDPITAPTLASLLSQTGEGIVDYVDIEDIAGYSVEYDYAADKITVRQSAAAGNPEAEITGAAAYPAALTARPLRCHVRGR